MFDEYNYSSDTVQIHTFKSGAAVKRLSRARDFRQDEPLPRACPVTFAFFSSRCSRLWSSQPDSQLATVTLIDSTRRSAALLRTWYTDLALTNHLSASKSQRYPASVRARSCNCYRRCVTTNRRVPITRGRTRYARLVSQRSLLSLRFRFETACYAVLSGTVGVKPCVESISMILLADAYSCFTPQNKHADLCRVRNWSSPRGTARDFTILWLRFGDDFLGDSSKTTVKFLFLYRVSPSRSLVFEQRI